MPESSRTPTPPPDEPSAAGESAGGEGDGALVSTLADHPTLKVLVRGFVKRLPKRLEELRNAFRRSDFEALANLAHGLRGAGGTYGFKPLTEAAGHLEQRVREGAAQAEIAEALGGLCHVCERVSK